MGGEKIAFLEEGHEVGGYRIESASGAYDGYAPVYKARRIGDRLAVSIAEFLPAKIAQRSGDYVDPAWGAEAAYDTERERFDAEAAALAGIDHANLLPTIARLRAGGTSYRVTARRRGSSLARILERAVLSQREIVEILDPLLGALEKVHGAGCLHTAITPDAILVRKDGTPLLAGTAGARTGYWRGLGNGAVLVPEAAPYRAPELSASDASIGPASDIYAFACVLHRAITGKAPQPCTERAREDQTVPSAARTEVRFRKEFLDAIDAGLALDPGRRPQSVAVWRRMLRPDRRRIR
ncbi:MAG: protein kinase domain-containing protein [Alphaproteobacteria bacterium]